jgi:hypothetical protein
MRYLKVPMLVAGLMLTALAIRAMLPSAVHMDSAAIQGSSWDVYAPTRISPLPVIGLFAGLSLIAVSTVRRWRRRSTS